MTRLLIMTAGATATLLLSTACSAATTRTIRAQASPTPPSAIVTPLPCGPYTSFGARNFSHAAAISNRWFPLVPGTQMIFTGTSSQDGTPTKHREEFTVTGLTKMVDGVDTRVITDRDFNDGSLDEQELTFFAQDNSGNVWNLGEYPEDYEDNKLTGAPDTWIAGAAGAEGGVQLPATSRVGAPAYRQGFSPGIKFLDCGKALETGQNTCVGSSCYTDVLVVDEWSPLDPKSGHQRKFYASAFGVVKITAVDDPEAEETHLTSTRHLSPQQLADANKAALAMDERAYHSVAGIYAKTEPAR